MIIIDTANIGNKTINCYGECYDRETLKKWDKKDIILCPICNKTYEYK